MSEPPAEQTPYGAPQGDDQADLAAGRRVVGTIDGHPGRKLNNALTLTFVEDGSDQAFAKAQQGKGDGMGKKLGILFGFKNYEAATNVLDYVDGGSLVVPTRNREPTSLTRGDGTAVATITRGETTVATDPAGAIVARFTPDPLAHKTDARYRLLVLDGAGGELAMLDLLRSSADAWQPDALDVVDGVVNFGWSTLVDTDTGGSLPNLFAGTRLRLLRTPTPLEREVLLAASVELGVCARAYTPQMGQETAWG